MHDAEVAHAGNIAKDLNTGLVVPIHRYQYVSYSHGSLLFGFVLAPFYYFLGPYFSVILLVEFLIGLLIFFVWIRVAFVSFGPKAIAPFILLVLFPTPFALDMATRSYANHYESILFTGLALLMLDQAIRKNHTSAFVILFGFINGAGALFCSQGIITAGVVFLCWLYVLPGRSLLLKVPLFFSGFLLSYLPGVYIDFLNGDLFRTLTTGFNYQRQFSSLPAHGWHLITDVLLKFPGFNNQLLNYTFIALFVASWCMLAFYLIIRNRSPKPEDPAKDQAVKALQLSVLTFPILWIGAYSASPFSADAINFYEMRYTIVLLPFFLVVLAGVASRFRFLALGLALTLAIVVMADGTLSESVSKGINTLQRADAKQRLQRYWGYSYDNILFWKMYADQRSRLIGRTDRMEPRFTSYLHEIQGVTRLNRELQEAENQRSIGLDFGQMPDLRLRGAMEEWARVALLQGRGYKALQDTIHLRSQYPDEFFIGLGSGIAIAAYELHKRGPTDAIDSSLWKGDVLQKTDSSIESATALVRNLTEQELALVARGVGYGAGKKHFCDRFLQLHALLVRYEPWKSIAETEYLYGYDMGRARMKLLQLSSFPVQGLRNSAEQCQIEGTGLPADAFAEEVRKRGFEILPIENSQWMSFEYTGAGSLSERGL